MATKNLQDKRLVRVSPTELGLPNPHDIPVRLYATDDVLLESSAVDELVSFLDVSDTVDHLWKSHREFFDSQPRIREVAVTPDFHRGAGIPIGSVVATEGFALPQAIGNDINCGMRLITTSRKANEVRSVLGELEKALRYRFFEGGRNVALTASSREALLKHGLPGLLSDKLPSGLWDIVRSSASPDIHNGGGYSVDNLEPTMSAWIQGSGPGPTYDSKLGSLGGGNHFCELQEVRRIVDVPVAKNWGLKVGQLVVMVHAGSLGLGHTANTLAGELLRRIWPKGLSHPVNGIFPLPSSERFAPDFSRFLSWLYTATNFAFGNRFVLGLMAQRAIIDALGDTECRTLYDAPHNLMWESDLGVEGRSFLHRKGATPAHGVGESTATRYGEPVIVPGSMGAPSWLLVGHGHVPSMCSACHGAGRSLTRGDAARRPDKELDEFLSTFRVVTPLNPNRPDVRGRRDILKKWRETLKKEAPVAYKEIGPAVTTLQNEGIARPVAELYPIMTVKG